jgi:hypothetical protein
MSREFVFVCIIRTTDTAISSLIFVPAGMAIDLKLTSGLNLNLPAAISENTIGGKFHLTPKDPKPE